MNCCWTPIAGMNCCWTPIAGYQCNIEQDQYNTPDATNMHPDTRRYQHATVGTKLYQSKQLFMPWHTQKTIDTLHLLGTTRSNNDL
jgi:hypothetical protein